jgi:hypothetical protein
MALVYLICCDHEYAQTYPASSDLNDPQNKIQREFKQFILDSIQAHQPLVIAEEMSAERLQTRNRKSVVAEAANETSTHHIYADPNPVQRQSLGIVEDLPFFGPSAPLEWQDHITTEEEAFLHDLAHRCPRREEFWIREIQSFLNQPLLFVCGDSHRWTFRRRLEARGIQVRVIGKRFGATPLRKDHFRAYKRVRRNRFPTSECFCVSPIPDQPIVIS